MNVNCLLFCLVAVPLFGSALLPTLGKIDERLRNIVALALMLFSLGMSCALLPVIANGENVVFALGGVTLFYADKLAIFMALVSQSVGSIIILYSFGYIKNYEYRNEYYFMVVLFLAAMMGLVFSSNILWIYFFWEITAIVCWRLIGFFRDKEYVIRADKAFFVTVFGALMMLCGFLMVYSQTGTFDLREIREWCTANGSISNIAVLFILFGILSKSATLPLHTWLADAGVAPSPVTALLHAAVLVKIGVYVFARLLVATFVINEIWFEIVPWIAAASALVSACAALVETDIKRIVAYSTVSQLAFIFLGLSTGRSEIGLIGGLLYILMHGIAKAGLFLCAGIVEHETHNKDIRKMGGLVKTMPVTAVSFALCAFSVMGIPPFGGFFSKYMVIAGTVGAGQVAVGLTFVAGAFLTLAYLLRVFTLVFLGSNRAADDGHGLPHEGTPVMVFSVALLAALSLLSGVVIQPSFQFAQNAVQQMLSR